MLIELINYLRQNYYSLDELCINLNIEPNQILQWVKSNCIPAHSYEINEQASVNSFFGKHALLDKSSLYFNKNIVGLIEIVQELSAIYPLEKITEMRKQDFLTRYQQQLCNLGVDKYWPELVDNNQNIINDKLLALVEHEWQSYCKGIYGLCTITMQPEQIAIKEAMINYIKILTKEYTKESLSEADVKELLLAVTRLDAVLPLFAPHERPRSSRHLWVERIKMRYLNEK